MRPRCGDAITPARRWRADGASRGLAHTRKGFREDLVEDVLLCLVEGVLLLLDRLAQLFQPALVRLEHRGTQLRQLGALALGGLVQTGAKGRRLAMQLLVAQGGNLFLEPTDLVDQRP
jgi:hypothetical protein